jgi:hypothetical protein
MARDWDKELAKIDKQISSMSDADLTRVAPSSATPVSAPVSAPASAPAGRTAIAGGAVPPSMWSLYLRAGLSAAVAISVPFWPYASRCGLGLAGYLAGVSVVVAAGGWSALAAWRARAGRIHVLALTIIVWGLALVSIEVLPRVGYGKDAARATWTCK